MTLPTIIFVHGAWHEPSFFDKVRALLANKGYRTVAPQLPSVGRYPPVESIDPDIETVRAVVLKELDAGRDVVMNAHSYGGIVTNNALDGLSNIERHQQGHASSVLKLTYVSAFVLPEGASLFDQSGGREAATWLDVKEENVTPQNSIPILYHDCEPQEAEAASSKLQVHAVATFEAKAKFAAWRKIPSAYLVCENDRALPATAQDAMIDAAREQGGVIDVERIPSAHSPYIGCPELVAAFIDRAVGGDAVKA